VGLRNQPDFINAVAVLETALPPNHCSMPCSTSKPVSGAVRRDRNGPRTLDLDLLLYDDIELDLPRLTLPHPRLHSARLRPLPARGNRPGHDDPRGAASVAAWLPAVATRVVRL
jgi:2-amino-4-hydroxy-6-hydroxymethyldihydropteridine diphosphokinase